MKPFTSQATSRRRHGAQQLCAAVLLTALGCGPLQAQSCAPEVNASTPQSRFTINEDVVTDRRTFLRWQRCPVGYEWDNNGTSDVVTDDRCRRVSNELFDWGAALQLAQDLNNAGGIGGDTDWRIPNIKELLSIVERQCVFPAINTVAFPDTSQVLPRLYWSASPVDINDAYVLDYSTGKTESSSGHRASSTNLLRLVR